MLVVHMNNRKNIMEKYDVVVDTLQKKIDALWKMIQANMNADMMNIMDDIRLEQIDQLKNAIAVWNKRYERTN